MSTLPFVLALLAILMTGCGGNAAAAPRPTQTGAGHAKAQTADTAPVCPNPNGGQCLGPLEPGTYTTVTFSPAITYTVPAGWTNGEDLPGNFLLQLADDPRYIGIYRDANARTGAKSTPTRPSAKPCPTTPAGYAATRCCT